MCSRSKPRINPVFWAKIAERLADAKVKARLANLGVTTLAGSSADFARLIAEETEKWGKVVRATNIKLE